MQDPDQPFRLPRLDRWLARHGGGLPGLTNDGAVLLSHRLRIRRRAAAVGWGIGVLAVIAVAAPGHDSAAPWYATGMVLVAVAALTWAVLVRVGERRLAAELTRRVSRDSAIPVWRQLGLLRSINCLLAVLAGLAILVALIALHASAGLITLFAGLFVVVATLCGLALWELVHAPALAVDGGSLAADQRLRRQNVYYAVYPLVVLASSIPTVVGLFGGGHNPRLGRLTDSVWPWGFFFVFLLIEAIANELDKADPGQRPRRRTWKPPRPWGPFA